MSKFQVMNHLKKEIFNWRTIKTIHRLIHSAIKINTMNKHSQLQETLKEEKNGHLRFRSLNRKKMNPFSSKKIRQKQRVPIG